MRLLVLIASALIFAFGVSNAFAVPPDNVVYSNPYSPNSTNAWASATYMDVTGALIEQYCFADYYWDGSFDITDFHWWGATWDEQITGFTFEIWSHDGGSGKPGSLMYQEFFAGDAGATYFDYNSNYSLDVFKYGVDLSAPFNPGVADYYWFSVYAHTTDNWWFWALGDGVQFNGDWATLPPDYWEQVGLYDGDFAFELTGGDPIPEPATMILVGLGLLGMAARRRMKN